MSEEKEDKFEIFETRTFKKAFQKLPDATKDLVDDEIELISQNPNIGTRKKGDLDYLWVHKFKLNKQEVLLGYSWSEEKLTIHLLSLGPHENFYESAKSRRAADLKLIG